MRLSAFVFSLVILSGLAHAQSEPELAPENQPPQLDDLDTLVPEAPVDEGAREVVREAERDGIDGLFEDLAAAEPGPGSVRIAQRIQLMWLESGSDAVDLLMNRAAVALHDDNLGLAMDLLDHVVMLAPKFAEGWNRRATVFYMQEEFGKSLADIERTLALEPRHWGAMSGLGMIQRRLGEDEAALSTFRQALDLHPGLENARKSVEQLEKAAEGRPI